MGKYSGGTSTELTAVVETNNLNAQENENVSCTYHFGLLKRY